MSTLNSRNTSDGIVAFHWWGYYQKERNGVNEFTSRPEGAQPQLPGGDGIKESNMIFKEDFNIPRIPIIEKYYFKLPKVIKYFK